MKIRHHKDGMTGHYEQIIVTEGTATIESGLLDKSEAKELAQELRNVADQLDPEG